MSVTLVLLTICMAVFAGIAVYKNILFGPLIVSELVIFLFSPADNGRLYTNLAWGFVQFDAAVVVIRFVIFRERGVPAFTRALIVSVPYLAVIGRFVLSTMQWMWA